MLKAFSELQFNQINKRKYQFRKYKTEEMEGVKYCQ